MDQLTLGDKIYVSSKRAADITGYAKDYIGQLCREGRVEARLVGRSWYVLESAIRSHKFGLEPQKIDQSDEERDIDYAHYEPEEPSSIPVIERTEKAAHEAWEQWFDQLPELKVATEAIDPKALGDEVVQIRALRAPKMPPQRREIKKTDQLPSRNIALAFAALAILVLAVTSSAIFFNFISGSNILSAVAGVSLYQKDKHI